MTCQIDVLCLEVAPGQRLAVSGASPDLGSWEPSRAVPLTCSSQGLWSGSMPRQDVNAKFKLLILNADATLAAWEPLKHSRKWPAEAAETGTRLRTKYGKKRMKVDKGRSGSWLDSLTTLLGCCLAPEQDMRSEMNLGPPHPPPPRSAPTNRDNATSQQATKNAPIGQPEVQQATKNTPVGQPEVSQAVSPEHAPSPATGGLTGAKALSPEHSPPPAVGGPSVEKAISQNVAPKMVPAPPTMAKATPPPARVLPAAGTELPGQATPPPARVLPAAGTELPGQVEAPTLGATPPPAPRPAATTATPSPLPKAGGPTPTPQSTAAEEVKAKVREVELPMVEASAPSAEKVSAPAAEKVDAPWFKKPSVGTWLLPVAKPRPLPCADSQAATPCAALDKTPLSDEELQALTSMVVRAVLAASCRIVAQAEAASGPPRTTMQWACMPSVATWAVLPAERPEAAACKKIEEADLDFSVDLLGLAEPVATKLADENLGSMTSFGATDLAR